MVKLSADDTIAGPQRAGNRPCEGKRHRRHVCAKAHALRVGIEQLTDHYASAFEQRIGGVCLYEGAMGVGVVAAR
jgi:hypothetical protein